MAETAGRLTVLTTLGIRAVKTFTRRHTDGRVHVEGYGQARRFRAKEIETDDEGLWLRRLFKKKNSFVVLGEPVDWPEGELRRRLSEDDGEDKATLRDVPRVWMPIDLDHLNFEPWADHQDGETLAIEALDMLGLKGTRCVWHLTGSHNIEGKYRIRLWICLRDPVTCKAMKRYAQRWKDLTVDEGGKQRLCVDTSILRPAQPIYTGTPVFVDMDDPVERRSGLIKGKRLKLKNVEVEDKRKDDSGDENVEKLREAGLYIKAASKPGHHMIVCPWEDGHSGEAKDNDTFYYEPNYEGKDYPFFRCFHESCQHKDRRWADVEHKMGWSSVFTKVKDDDGEDGAEEDFVYVHRLEQFWDPRDGEMISTKAFDSMNGHSGGRSKKGSPTERFLSSKNTVKADSVAFSPGEDRMVRRSRLQMLNMYVDHRIEPDPEKDASPFVDHAEWLIPDERARNHVLDWMAWALQHPERKITWAPVLFGPQGTGKTTLFTCLAECIGRVHVSEPTQAEIEEKFNDWCFGKLLVKIEELRCGEKFLLAERLKPIIANDTISVRRLYHGALNIRNTVNVCASTNHPDAVALEITDRRYMMVKCCEPAKEERTRHMREFYRWLGRTGHRGIAAWLMARDVSRFKPESEAPMTDLKTILIESSKDDFQRAVDACDILDGEPVITSEMIFQVCEDNNLANVAVRRYGHIALHRGWLAGGRVRHKKRRLSLWTSGHQLDELNRVKGLEPDVRDAFFDKLHVKKTFVSQTASKRAEKRWRDDE